MYQKTNPNCEKFDELTKHLPIYYDNMPERILPVSNFYAVLNVYFMLCLLLVAFFGVFFLEVF